MQIIEQKKLIEELKNYKNKMTRDEAYQFDMFTKRTKDDEDLDKLSFQKLQEIHKKYVVRKSKHDFDHLFKKKDDEK